MVLRCFAALAGLVLAVTAAGPARGQDGVTPTSVLIGQSAAFTGPAAQLGIQMRAGAKLWIDHVNAQGGINGRTIELKSRDDKYEAALAAENTRRLINDDRVFALFAYVGTPTSQASLPVFTEAKVPFVAPFTGAELLRQPFNRYVFNVRASYYDETEAIVEHLTRIGARKIAVFHQADSFGQAGLDGTTRALDQARPQGALGEHRGAQHHQRRRGGEDDPRLPARRGGDDLGLRVDRGVRPPDEEVGQPRVVLHGLVRRQQGTCRRARARRARGDDLAGRALPVEPADAGGQGIPRPREARRQPRGQLLDARGLPRPPRC